MPFLRQLFLLQRFYYTCCLFSFLSDFDVAVGLAFLCIQDAFPLILVAIEYLATYLSVKDVVLFGTPGRNLDLQMKSSRSSEKGFGDEDF